MRSILHLFHPILTLLPFRAHFQSSADLKLGENIVNFGVIGYGYWGPNIVRNLTSLENSQVLAIAEMSPSARSRAQKAYPSINVTADALDVILSPKIDAVAIVTPVWTHFELAKAALENGKQ